jgi:hypothetical protein
MELLKLVSESLGLVHSGQLVHPQVKMAADDIDRN